MNAFILEKALEMADKAKRSEAAIRHIIESYFEEYSDATDLDDGFSCSLDHVFELLFPSGETEGGMTLHELTQEIYDERGGRT